MTVIDTNQVAQVAQTVTAIQTQFNWPAIAAAALWVRSDLAKGADYIISHGGLGWMLRKLIWNPPLTASGPLPAAQNPSTLKT